MAKVTFNTTGDHFENLTISIMHSCDDDCNKIFAWRKTLYEYKENPYSKSTNQSNAYSYIFEENSKKFEFCYSTKDVYIHEYEIIFDSNGKSKKMDIWNMSFPIQDGQYESICKDMEVIFE